MESIAVATANGTAGDELDRVDRARLQEWWTTVAEMRFHQCPWPPGLRAVFAELAAQQCIAGPLLEAEKSEEDLAEQEAEGTETGGDIGRSALPHVLAELDTLRAAGRDAGLTGVTAWFDQRGLRFDLTATGVGRIVHEQTYRPARMVVGGTYVPRRT
jgi:hypothetical protein